MQEIIKTLKRNASEVRFGTVSAVLTIHEGRVVKVVYETAKTTVTRNPLDLLLEDPNINETFREAMK